MEGPVRRLLFSLLHHRFGLFLRRLTDKERFRVPARPRLQDGRGERQRAFVALSTAWGSNIDFPTTGPGIEIDLSGGVKFLAFKRKLSFDFGYIRYLYPGVPVDLAYDYGEFNLNVGYDFGVATLAGRIRYSPHSFGDSGNSWNRRALLSVPLPFLAFSENVSFKAYGSLGNFAVDRFLAYGIPSGDYWYWQVGLITKIYGLDFNVAYTDTSIEPAGCGNTNYCSGRVFVGVTKAF